MTHPNQPATIVAGTDTVPRLVRQFTALFLVTPKGEVWRVFDSDEPTGSSRFTPSDSPTMVARVFLGSGTRAITRVYRFGHGESRAIDAERLQEQLIASKVR